MSSSEDKIKHLDDHLPYELLMLRHTYQQVNSDRNALDWNAFHESFAVHARILLNFLINDAGSTNFQASGFSNFIAEKDATVQRIIRQDLNKQVFHLGKSRPSEADLKVAAANRKLVFEWIESNFRKFLEQLHKDWKPHWNSDRADLAKVRERLLKAEGELSVKAIGRQQATGTPGVVMGPTGFSAPPRGQSGSR